MSFLAKSSSICRALDGSINSESREWDSLNAGGNFKVSRGRFVLHFTAARFPSFRFIVVTDTDFDSINFTASTCALWAAAQRKGESEFRHATGMPNIFTMARGGKGEWILISENFRLFRRFISAAFAFYAPLEDFLSWKNIHLTQTTINHAMHINVALSSLNRFSLMWVGWNGMTGGICA